MTYNKTKTTRNTQQKQLETKQTHNKNNTQLVTKKTKQKELITKTTRNKTTRNKKKQMKNYFAHETAVIDEGCNIGNDVKIWHFSHIMSSCIIGERCNIGQNVVISPEVILGKNVKIQNNVSVYTGVICEDDVFLGPSMVFTNVINPRSAVNRRNEYAKTLVKKGASIGANATIICGNTIGEYAMIGAGAVITKSVKPYALVVGNPAKQIGWVSEYGHRLDFNENRFAICPETKQEYLLKENSVIRTK